MIRRCLACIWASIRASTGLRTIPLSSCMSCHATGQVASVSAIMPWLPPNNIPKPENGTEASDELDALVPEFLGLVRPSTGARRSAWISRCNWTKSVENYIEYINATQQGHFALEYWGNTDSHPVSRGALEASN